MVRCLKMSQAIDGIRNPPVLRAPNWRENNARKMHWLRHQRRLPLVDVSSGNWWLRKSLAKCRDQRPPIIKRFWVAANVLPHFVWKPFVRRLCSHRKIWRKRFGGPNDWRGRCRAIGSGTIGWRERRGDEWRRRLRNSGRWENSLVFVLFQMTADVL